MNKTECKYYILTLLLIGVSATMGAEQNPAPIVLRRADLLRTETAPEGPIRYLDGNVWITQDTLSITCEHATYEEGLGRLFFEEKVHFIEPSRQIWADQAIYYERDGRAVAEGNVRIDQDSLIIWCDRVIYSEAREEALFFGDVRLRAVHQDAELTGHRGLYNRARDSGVMTLNPQLVRWFDQSDSMVVVGRLIEYYFQDEYAVVTDSVHVSRGSFDAWGGILYYWNAEERTRLIGNPFLRHKRDVLTADTVDAYFQDQHLRRVVLTGQAEATSPVDSLAPEPVNWMTGHSITIVFQKGELDSIKVRGNATSVYYIREEGEKKGVNRVSGDLIDMWVSQDQIRWIYVEGGTEGVYYPRHLEQHVMDDEIKPPAQGRGFP